MNNDGYKLPMNRVVGLLLLLVLVPLAIYFSIDFFTKGRLEVSVPEGETHAITITNQDSGEEVIKNRNVSDTTVFKIPNGEYAVYSTYKNRGGTTHFVSVPRFYGKRSVSSESANQASRTKLGRGAQSCPVYAGNTLYSYNCYGSAPPIVTSPPNASSPSKQTVIAALSEHRLIAAASYGDGMLALYEADDEHGHDDSDGPTPRRISLVRSGRITTTLDVPAGFLTRAGDVSTLDMSVASEDREDFIVYSARGGVFLYYETLASTPRTIQISEPDLEETLTRRSFELKDDYIVGFYGTASAGDSSVDKKDHLTMVVTYRLGSGEAVDQWEIPVSYEEATLCGDSIVCLLTTGNELVLHNLQAQRQLVRLPGVTSIVALPNGNVAYLNDRSIYLLSGVGSETMSARMLFTSTRYQASRLQAGATSSGEPRILFNAFYERGGQQNVTHTFLLSLEPADSNLFMDDYLPLASVGAGSGSLIDMDYAGNTILGTLELDSAQRVNNAVVYSQSEFNEVSSAILKRLGEAGFAKPEYRINFVVSY